MFAYRPSRTLPRARSARYCRLYYFFSLPSENRARCETSKTNEGAKSQYRPLGPIHASSVTPFGVSLCQKREIDAIQVNFGRFCKKKKITRRPQLHLTTVHSLAYSCHSHFIWPAVLFFFSRVQRKKYSARNCGDIEFALEALCRNAKPENVLIK